jgi:hypothetical protein
VKSFEELMSQINGGWKNGMLAAILQVAAAIRIGSSAERAC